MHKKFYYIGIGGVICVALQVWGISNNIESRFDYITGQNENLSSEISSLARKVSALEEELEEKNESEKIIEQYRITIEKTDLKTLTTKVFIQVVPKKVTKDTKTYITIGEQQYEIARKGDSFEGQITLNLLDTINRVFISIESDGSSLNQDISTDNELLDLPQHVFTNTFSFDEYPSISIENGNVILNGSFFVSYDWNNDAVVSARVYAEWNGTEIWSDDSISKWKQDGEYHFNQQFSKDSGKITLHLEIKGQSGLTYRNYLCGVLLEEGEYYEQELGGKLEVYSEEGTLLYTDSDL